jgi:undecaprenyl diphosphate synthase
MNDYDNLSKDEFLSLPTSKIANIVKQKGIPKTCVLIPDGGRRYALALLKLDPNKKDYEEKYTEVETEEFLENVKIILNHGIKNLIFPLLKHENFDRDKRFVEKAINLGLKRLLKDNKWCEFYNKYGIKIKVYGDFDFIKNNGFEYIIEWIDEIEQTTNQNSNYKIFYGVACSNKYEIPRLMDLTIDFYKINNRKPNFKEKLTLYYGDEIDDVDIFIRPTEVRDSDIQPPLISGNRTQMYFPVAPNYMSITSEIFKEILYDYLFCRSSILGSKVYSKVDMDYTYLKDIEIYYKENKKKVLGIGKRIGNFWIPEI